MVLVIDIGNAMIMKNHTDGVIEMVLDLALDKKIEDNQVKELLDSNIGTHRNIVTLSNDSIEIDSSTYVKGIFSNIFGFRGFYIESNYVGVKKDNKKSISKKK